MDVIPLSFGDALGALVRARGLTLAACAQRLNMTPSTLSRLHTGTRLPTTAQVDAIALALKCSAEERTRLAELAQLAHTPPAVRARLDAAERHVHSANDAHDRLARDYGAYRSAQGFHDGWWLTFSTSFQDGGQLQRSLLRITADVAELQVREYGRLRYSYHGTFEPLGDKAFLRLTEDRGGVEYVQIVLDSLFDFPEPSFVYGLILGISGKDVHHPQSFPACSRFLMLHIGHEHDLPADGETMQRIHASLGSFDSNTLRECWPKYLGNGDYHAQCLRLGDESLDQAIRRLIDNRLSADEQVLRARLSAPA